MAEGTIEELLKNGVYDRSLSLTAVITGAISILCIVFACADWSHVSLMGITSQAVNLVLFCAGLIFFLVAFALWIWLRTHDIQRVRYLALMVALPLAGVAIGFVTGRFMTTGHI